MARARACLLCALLCGLLISSRAAKVADQAGLKITCDQAVGSVTDDQIQACAEATDGKNCPEPCNNIVDMVGKRCIDILIRYHSEAAGIKEALEACDEPADLAD